jgi:AcrR family transcriptional regulator
VTALRSDARRNRARLIEVAAAAFRDEGLEVGVDEIARRAGVGIATLYRHFPSKSDLILAIVESALGGLEDAVEVSPPERAVGGLLERALEHQRRDRGFLEALAERHLPPEVRERLRRRALGIVGPVADAGHRSGTLRADADAADLLVAIKMLGAVCGEQRPPDRYLDVLLRGLAPSGAASSRVKRELSGSGRRPPFSQ